jgi:hypothetical protein
MAKRDAPEKVESETIHPWRVHYICRRPADGNTNTVAHVYLLRTCPVRDHPLLVPLFLLLNTYFYIPSSLMSTL